MVMGYLGKRKESSSWQYMMLRQVSILSKRTTTHCVMDDDLSVSFESQKYYSTRFARNTNLKNLIGSIHAASDTFKVLDHGQRDETELTVTIE